MLRANRFLYFAFVGSIVFLGFATSAHAATFSFVDSAVSSGSTIVIPATARKGDFAILVDGAVGASTPTSVTPTGWATDANITSALTRVMISRKVLVTGDSGSTITGMNGGIGDNKVMVVFRPSASILTVLPSTPTGESTSGDPGSQTIEMVNATTPVIGLAHFFSSGAINPRTNSPSMTEISNGTDQYVHYIIYNSSPLTHTIDMDDEGNNTLQGIYYEFTITPPRTIRLTGTLKFLNGRMIMYPNWQ